jgi:hypothetical protein
MEQVSQLFQGFFFFFSLPSIKPSLYMGGTNNTHTHNFELGN